MLSQVFDFLTTILFGRIAFKLFEWLSNPANTDKIISIFRFIKDWWPLILGGIIAFLPGLLGPAGLIIGTIALVTWGIVKITDAIKSIFGFGPKIDKELKSGSDKFNKDIQASGKDIESKLEPGKEQKDGMPDTGNPSDSGVPAEISGAQDSQAQVQKLNKGGQVSGSGNKDTVPAMLTPGEFVMSKGAVEQYGVNTLEGMNAAAGGTNIPTVQKGGDKGMNLSVPRFSGGGQGGKIDKSHYGTTGYRIGQVMPDQYVYDFSKYTSSYKTKGGEVIEDKETLTELGGAIGVPDLLEHQKQLVGDIRKVEGYENVNIIDVMERMNGRGRLVSMPDETLYPILNASDAYKATGDKMVAAHKIDLASRGITDPSKGYSMMYNGGGLVQGLNGGGLIQKFNKGGLVSNLSNSSNSISYFNGGGLVSNLSNSSNSISNFNGGGLIQKFNEGGIVKLLGNKAKGVVNFAKEKIAQVSSDQKPRVDHLHLDPPKRPASKAAAAQVAQSSGDAATISNEKAAGLPPIDASSMRSQSKIRTLGLSV